jgi:hypothetical protein
MVNFDENQNLIERWSSLSDEDLKAFDKEVKTLKLDTIEQAQENGVTLEEIAALATPADKIKDLPRGETPNTNDLATLTALVDDEINIRHDNLDSQPVEISEKDVESEARWFAERDAKYAEIESASMHLVFDPEGRNGFAERNDFAGMADMFRPTNKESYSVYACIAPVGTEFENPLENAKYETKNADTVILSGTQGELWTTNKEKVAKTYQINGQEIEYGAISKDCGKDGVCADWVEIQTKPQPKGSVFAMQLGENQTATVETSWATLEAKSGGFIVCDGDKDGKPDMSSLRVIDEEVFMKTHNLEAFPELQEKARDMDLSTPKPEQSFVPENYKTITHYANGERDMAVKDSFSVDALKDEIDYDALAAEVERKPEPRSPSVVLTEPAKPNISEISRSSVVQKNASITPQKEPAETSAARYEDNSIDKFLPKSNDDTGHDGLGS